MGIAHITGPHLIELPANTADEIARSAPLGWVAFQLATEIADHVPPPRKKPERKKKAKKPRERKKKKPDTPIQKMEEMFGGQVKPGEKKPKFGKSSQKMRGVETDGKTLMPYDDMRNFAATIPLMLAEVRSTAPQATHVRALWWIHPPYLEADQAKEFKDVHERDLNISKRYMEDAIKANPLIDFDYSQLARDFPTLKRNQIRSIASRIRKNLEVTSPREKTQRDKILELKAKGLKTQQIIDVFVKDRAGIDPQYVRQIAKRGSAPDYKRIQRETLKREGRIVPIKSLRARASEKRAATTPVDLATPDLSPSRFARELLRQGSSYDDVEKRLAERGTPLARKGLRALKSQLPKGKK